MRKIIFLSFLLCFGFIVRSQDEAADKTGLLLSRCSFEPGADIMVLRDKAELSVNADYSLRLDRQLTIKFFDIMRMNKAISDIVFYPSSSFSRYTKLVVTAVDIDQTTKGVLPRDVTGKVTSTHLDLSGIRAKRGSLLKISYTINFAYDEKIPDWRFQSVYPTDYSDLKVSIPEPVTLKATLEGPNDPEINTAKEVSRQVHLNSEMQPLKMKEIYCQFNQLPSHRHEVFNDNSPQELQLMHFQVVSVSTGTEVKKNFAARQVDKIVEALSVRPDFLLRLSPDLPLRADYDRRIRTLSLPEEKVARIYDLVRRHMAWDLIDSVSARPLSRLWADKKGNSTEINLILVKLLQVYGFEASPMLVSTRGNGHIDSNNVALTDFDRTVAYLRIGEKNVILDATARYFDYPLISSSILNTTGLLISMDRHRWISVADDRNFYKNNVVLLGHLLGDSSFLTNVYVNSTGYAKAEHLEIYERDSLKGIRNYFERGDKSIHFKHFIVANEYIDTLPLAQEFDIRAPLIKNDNLYGVVTTWYSIPDTLFAMGDSRKSSVNFGYKQQYDLVSEFSFPERYEIYLMPNNLQMSAVNGNVHFEREYHSNTSSFSMRQSLIIDKSYFTPADAADLARFLKKINNLLKQQVVLKRLN